MKYAISQVERDKVQFSTIEFRFEKKFEKNCSIFYRELQNYIIYLKRENRNKIR